MRPADPDPQLRARAQRLRDMLQRLLDQAPKLPVPPARTAT